MGIHKEEHQLINCKSNSSGIIIVHKVINNNILSVQEKKYQKLNVSKNSKNKHNSETTYIELSKSQDIIFNSFTGIFSALNII